ncbi:amidohydrolase family protein [Roseobacter litoralis]|uniref:amidohydrolase family protein n=1 Tax=Roseobacter litoralis TaxID=42443 RepID=UPI002491F42C|nr:amidohydrolase family protein [Roseobacter litoralis]
MKIVDPHFHIWDLSQLSYPWLTTGPSTGVFGDNTPIRKTCTLGEYLAQSGSFHVAKTVHVEAAVAQGQDLQETAWLERVAQVQGQPNAIVAYCDLSSEAAKAKLDGQRRTTRVRGIRQILNTHDDELLNFAPQEFMENDLWLEGFELLSARDLSFDMQIYPSQMAAAAQLARQNNGTRIVLNHTGMPLGHDPASFNAWRAAMSELSLCDNVSVKISGLGMMFHDWTTEMIRPFVRETMKLFGADRCMFASNFPVDSMFSTFETLWTAYRDIVSDLSSAEQDKVFHQTAERIYRI